MLKCIAYQAVTCYLYSKIIIGYLFLAIFAVKKIKQWAIFLKHLNEKYSSSPSVTINEICETEPNYLK